MGIFGVVKRCDLGIGLLPVDCRAEVDSNFSSLQPTF
jgi:hypothetical protein